MQKSAEKDRLRNRLVRLRNARSKTARRQNAMGGTARIYGIAVSAVIDR